MSRRGACISTTLAGRRCAPRRPISSRKLPKAAWIVLAAALAITGPAQAAVVNAVQGQVLVSTGQGYRLVDGATQVEAGGTVVANPGAVAHVTYPGGCQVTVEPGSVYLIATQSPCQTGGKTFAGGLSEKAPASDGGKAVGATGFTMNPWLIGGAAAAIGGGTVYALKSISP